MEKLNDSSRAEFEAFMADSFKDSIDRRRCLNGDGNDYMSWDMSVARVVWQHLSQRAEAAEVECSRLNRESQNLSSQLGQCYRERRAALVKLAELEKQEPYLIPSLEHFISFWKKVQSGNMKPGENEISHTLWLLEELAKTELFTRPAPAADLAELVPLMRDLDAERENGYLERAIGWNDCRAAILRNIEEAKAK